MYSAVVKKLIFCCIEGMHTHVNTRVPFCSNKMLHTRLSSFLLFQGKTQVFTQVSQYSSGIWLLQCLCFFLPTRQWLPLFAAESTCPWTAVNFSNRLTFSRGKIKEFYEQHLIIYFALLWVLNFSVDVPWLWNEEQQFDRLLGIALLNLKI